MHWAPLDITPPPQDTGHLPQGPRTQVGRPAELQGSGAHACQVLMALPPSRRQLLRGSSAPRAPLHETALSRMPPSQAALHGCQGDASGAGCAHSWRPQALLVAGIFPAPWSSQTPGLSISQPPSLIRAHWTVRCCVPPPHELLQESKP